MGDGREEQRSPQPAPAGPLTDASATAAAAAAAAAAPQIPLALVEVSVYGSWMYFMSGLTLEAGRYFFFLLVALLVDVFSATLFRAFVFGFPTREAAQTGPMPILAFLIIFAGFLVLPSKMASSRWRMEGRKGQGPGASDIGMPPLHLQGWMQFIYFVDPYASKGRERGAWRPHAVPLLTPPAPACMPALYRPTPSKASRRTVCERRPRTPSPRLLPPRPRRVLCGPLRGPGARGWHPRRVVPQVL